MEINELDQLLKKSPIVIKGNLIPLAFIEDVIIQKDVNKFLKELDSPNTTKNGKIVLIDEYNTLKNKFPILSINDDYITPELNNILFENYNFINNNVFSQNDIADIILANIDTELIILLMVDGLSYLDCKDFIYVKPCFVNGATITEVGFRNIINDPPIAFRLFNKGFKQRYGFSYWTRSNELTDLFFKGFSDQQMFKVGEFDKIIDILNKKSLYKSYIQIIVNGCDQIAHGNKERPILKHVIDRIFNDYLSKLIKLCKDKKLKSKIYITSDHGIWWKPKINEKIEQILLKNIGSYKPRFFIGDLNIEASKNVTCYGINYSLLKYPYIFKDFDIDQWGVHGGLSIYESFVPFITVEVKA